jgi:hypothetical protein
MMAIVVSVRKQLERSNAKVERVRAKLAAAPDDETLQHDLETAAKENANLSQALSNGPKLQK